MCRKISKFDYAPNPTWQVAEVGERAGRWQWKREGGWFYMWRNFNIGYTKSELSVQKMYWYNLTMGAV